MSGSSLPTGSPHVSEPSRSSARAFAIVLASGTGTRFGGLKQLAKWRGKTLLEWTLQSIHEVAAIHSTVVATNSRDVAASASMYASSLREISLADGGEHRLETFQNGLTRLRAEIEVNAADTILLVDANRPLTPHSVYKKCIDLAQETAVTCPAIPISDGVAVVEEGYVSDIPVRSKLIALQTPEAARFEDIQRLPSGVWQDRSVLGLCEAFLRSGIRPLTFPGSPLGMKVTFPHDVTLLEGLAADYLHSHDGQEAGG